MEIREAILSYMLSIENLLIGCDCTGHANFLEPFNVHSVQEYIDNSRMTRKTTWDTDVEMLCFSHFNVYMFLMQIGQFLAQPELREDYHTFTTSRVAIYFLFVSSAFTFLCGSINQKNVIIQSCQPKLIAINKQSSVVVYSYIKCLQTSLG